MINNINPGGMPPYETKSDVTLKKYSEGNAEMQKDCYQKMSDRDVPMMKGDRGPRLRTSYKRWDRDLQAWDKREAGSLPLMRRDTKAGKLAKTYREFADINMKVSLGTLRNIYGAIGLNALRQAIRRNGVPDNLRT